MTKSKTIRFPIFLVLSFLVVATMSISGSRGHAAAKHTEDRENLENFAYLPYVALESYPFNNTNCRYGIAAGYYDNPTEWLDYLGAGHYIHFGPGGTLKQENVELLRQIRVRQDKRDGEFLPAYTIDPPLTMENDGLGPLLVSNMGSVWMVGNEPEVPSKEQDRINPDWYARAYHEVYNFIKTVDPTAQVAIAGLSMMTPGRLQYLDIAWDTYLKEFGEPMPVDVWNTHLYILAEIRPWDGGPADGKVALGTDPELAVKAPGGSYETQCPKEDVYCRAEHDDIDIFIEQIMALRTWMKEHGQQDKPLILSEFSQLYPFKDYDDLLNPTTCYLADEFGECFSRPRVTTFLHKTIDFLESAKDPGLGFPADDFRLVQQWTWYSAMTTYDSGQSSNLLENDYHDFPPGAESAMTQMGIAFRDRATSSERTVNLVAGNLSAVAAKTNSGTTDVKLTVGFYNNGSTAISDTFTVSFYKDEALTELIGSTAVKPGTDGLIRGCSWNNATNWTTITWANAPTGTHTLWAKIDSHDQIGSETNEADNRTSGKVIVFE